MQNDVRLIDADALELEIINEYFTANNPSGTLTRKGEKIFNAAIDVARCKVRDAETVDAVPVVHGRWLTSSDIPDTLICSVCGKKFDMYHFDQKDLPYCLCGAKMDGDSP